MNWKRIGRAAICLLVVCCLLFNISPIKGHALVLESTAVTVVTVAAPIVVGTVLVGLGVQCAVVATFDEIVNLCVAHLEEIGLAQTMSIDVFGYTFEGTSLFGITPALIDAIRTWLFDSGILTETDISVSDGNWYYNGISYKPYPQDVDLSVYPYITMGFMGTSEWPYCIFTTKPLIVNAHYVSYNYYMSLIADTECDALVYSSYGTSNLTGWELYKEYENIIAGERVIALNSKLSTVTTVRVDLWTNYDLYGTQTYNSGELINPGLPAITDSCTVVSVPDGITAGDIANSGMDLQVGYPLWSNNIVDIIDSSSGSDSEDQTTVWSVPLPDNYSDVHDMKQEDVWKGNESSDNPSSDPDSLDDPLSNTPADRFIDRLVDAVTKPFEWLADTILTGIRSIFVPTEDYLTAKVDALRAEFSFADSIVRTADALKVGLGGVTTEPPVIYIDLGASEGSYDIGGEVPFLDLRWYAAYKPTVDMIISAFLWACFIWRMFQKLPGIISGMPGDFVMDGLNGIGIAEQLPARNAAYEVQRADNRRYIRGRKDG